jgi:hypothetical protein
MIYIQTRYCWKPNNNTSSNTTYKPTSFDKVEILANHRSFMTSLNIPSGKESEDYRVEKSKVLMEDTWEKDLDLRLSKRSLEFFKIHIWFMPLRE